MKSNFHQWGNIEIRLDIWHFLRRFASGCTSESHALYSTFMARLSACKCIFEWDVEDVQELGAAKASNLRAKGV